MRRVGVTGHQVIPASGLPVITERVKTLLSASLPFTLSTSLAAGADQLAATLALDIGGDIDVVIPSDGYEATLQGADLADYERLLRLASHVRRMPATKPDEEAFWQAGLQVLDQSDLLIAVWDGQPAAGLGGTADIVREAKNREIEVRIIWPQGLSRH